MVETDEFESSIADLLRAVGLLVRRIRSVNAVHDLSLTQAGVMARLDSSGAMTISDLARSECMKSQSMGSVVATLEEKGIVSRTPHPTDGRQVFIALTAEGSSLRKSLRNDKRAWLAEAVLRLPQSEQDRLFSASEILRKLAEE